MSDETPETSQDQAIKSNQTVRLSPDELKALIDQAKQETSCPDSKPWED